MARIFITGSSDGLGMMAATLLLKQGHQVVLHARNEKRAEDALRANPEASSVLIADLSNISETIHLADQANRSGRFDAVIHNAAIGFTESKKVNTIDNLPYVFAINSLAPYILTALIKRPERLIYLSSGLHLNGDSRLKDLLWEQKAWNGFQAYCDSKLHNVMLAFSVANSWNNVHSNALEPGWVATKLGGPEALGSISEAPVTQVWLATSNDPQVLQSGKYYYHRKEQAVHPDAHNINLQGDFIARCSKLSGVEFPK